jgi:hypothetical protein
VSLASLEGMGLLETLERKVILEKEASIQQEEEEIEEIRAEMVLLVCLESKVIMENKDREETTDLLVFQDPWVTLVLSVNLET